MNTFHVLQLIGDAIRYGDTHKHTMEMADYWLEEKQLVHKLFKVLVPRYENYQTAYTRLVLGPNGILPDRNEQWPSWRSGTAILELKGKFSMTYLLFEAYYLILPWFR